MDRSSGIDVSSFSEFITQGRAQLWNHSCARIFCHESDFESLCQYLPRFPWSGVYSTGSGLPALMDSHPPPRFSPGRPHCVILWLDGSARCPLPLTAQAGAARLLGILPVAPGQRVPYAYTDLFGFQGAQPLFPGCSFIVTHFWVPQESLVDALTMPI